MNKNIKLLYVILLLSILGLPSLFAQSNWINSVRTHWENGQLIAANKIIEQQLNQQKNYKEQFPLYYWKGFIVTEQQNLKEGQKWMDKAQKLAAQYPDVSKNVDYLSVLGWSYIQQEKLELAKVVLEQALQKSKNNQAGQFRVLSYLIHCNLESNQLENVPQLFSNLSKLDYKGSPREQLFLANQRIYYQVLTSKSLQAQSLVDSLSLFYQINPTWLEHPEYASYLNYSALVHSEIGNYIQAEYALNKAVKLNLASNRPIWYAFNLENLAKVYSFYEKEEIAFDNIQSALAIFEKNELIRKTCFTLLLKVGLLLEKDIIPEETESIFEKVRELIIANQLNKTVISAEYYNKLAYYRELQGKIATADTLYQKSLTIVEQKIGRSNRYYSQYLNGYAIFLDYQGRFEEAEKAYLQTAAIDQKVVGTNHPNYVDLLYGIAIFYVVNENYEKAANYYEKAVKNQLALIHLYYPKLDEKTRTAYTANALENLDVFFRFALEIHPTATLQNLVQTTFLQLKSLGERYQLYINQKANQQENSKKLLQIIKKHKEELLQYQLMSPSQRLTIKQSPLEMETTIGQLERQLNQQLDFQEITTPITNQSIIESLPDSSIAVDFISFNYFDLEDGWTDDIHYYAIVTKKNQAKADFIFLTKEETIKAAINNNNRQGIPQYANYFQRGALLYKEVFEKLSPHLADVRTVYLSPTRLLHRVAFEILPIDKEKKILDQYKIRYFSNLSSIVTGRDLSNTTKSIHLYGDAIFQVKITDEEDDSRGTFKNLPNTLKEVENIDSLAEAYQWKTKTFTGLDCQETNFRTSVAASPTILHVGSHGYFSSLFTKGKSSTVGQRISTDSSHTYLRSGILFNSADLSWQDSISTNFRKDGILTAFEINLLNMGQKNNTDLLVLSACQSGLGDILSNVEGAFGLKRAFKIAGANNLLLSLWKVPDAPTLALMTAFYTHFFNGVSKSEALHQAKQALKAKGHPAMNWGGFVLLE